MNIPRGIRNNNPGNIRKSSSRWKGKVPGSDPQFETFSSMPYGYRALIRLLQNYQTAHRLKTLRQLISRWAPSSENDTSAYISRMVRLTGFGPDERIDMKDRDTAIRVAAAVSKVENGVNARTEDIAEGWDLL